MPGRMAPLKKPRSTKKLPLALNPTKSKDVLAVLAERTQAIVPVGAWVEPASPNCSEIPAHASAYMIEEELKEKQRRKQESLKHFQRQVKHRVNQQVKLRKKQQLQRSYKAVEKEGSIVMQCSDSAQLTPKRTSVFSSNLNAIGSSRLPPSQVLEDAVEDGENQNQLFQQAQALSQTMKQARHQLASFKTVSEEKASVFLNGRRKSSPTQEKAPPRKPTCVNINKETREESPLKIQEDPLNTVHYRNFMENQNLGYEKISSVMTDDKRREDLFVQYQQDLLSEDKDKPFSKIQNTSMKQPASILRCEQGRKDLPLDAHQDFLCCHHHQSLYFRQQPSVRTDERWQEDLHLGGLQHLPHRHVRDTCSWRQVYDEYQTGLDTGFQAFLAFQSGVDQEEDKKERQKQFLRHRRLFMDIEREQVKEQKRQKEQKKKIEKIKKKKEQQRYAEEQRILRMNLREEPYSGEKISNIFAQLQLEEIKGAREKQQQREKEYARYVEALRAQVQEKMKLYNITLPPLCCCGPDFWDAHPDTCANNCIFYKNYRAYNRALHSVISSSDISEGNSTLRNAIRNFASAHRRTSKKAKECQQSAVSLYAKSRQLEAKWMSTTVSADPASQSTT
ncbi:coiled-coil domain-containing protein 15 isoform X4 [Nannospalax galili]|uniref:coiled-coil domain-containing protein 15 isoform X4 n=1 Tax=Nannospalax galili TaxID=1026970 RepID=UPI00111C4F61|nr:coiled-coil domain-containing protein 15 isoform X4 [Nannospalax galili]